MPRYCSDNFVQHIGLQSEHKFPKPTVSVRTNSGSQNRFKLLLQLNVNPRKKCLYWLGMIRVTAMNFSKKAELFIFCMKAKEAEHFAFI